VDEASFRSTQASLSAALKYNILDKFGVDWTQTQYEDLSKPLHSGIAAMLKIAKHYGSTDIPQSVASQARYWASSYTVNTWTDAIYVYTKASDAVANSKYFSFLFSNLSCLAFFVYFYSCFCVWQYLLCPGAPLKGSAPQIYCYGPPSARGGCCEN